MGAKSNVAYTRKAQKRSKKLNKLQKSNLMNTRSKMTKPTILAEFDTSRQVGGCIKIRIYSIPEKETTFWDPCTKTCESIKLTTFASVR